MKKKQKPPIRLVRCNAVLRYFANNCKAQDIAMSKSGQFYEENDTETCIEIIEGELENDR